MPRTWYEKISKLLSSRRVAAIFLVLYNIRLFAAFVIGEYFWFLPFLTLPAYFVLLILFASFLSGIQKRAFAAIFVILFIISSLISMPAYFSIRGLVREHIILPRIEEVAPEILNEYPPDTKVELKGFDKILSHDNYAVVKDGCIWFMQSAGSATSNPSYFVYTENPEPSEDYLTEHIYFENEEFVSESYSY